ncbi:MAG: hypothetical protein ABSH52_27590, partial [Terriglobia bacterium]
NIAQRGASLSRRKQRCCMTRRVAHIPQPLFEIRDQKADTRIPRSPGTHTHGFIHVYPFACPLGGSQGRPFIGNLATLSNFRVA